MEEDGKETLESSNLFLNLPKDASFSISSKLSFKSIISLDSSNLFLNLFKDLYFSIFLKLPIKKARSESEVSSESIVNIDSSNLLLNLPRDVSFFIFLKLPFKSIIICRNVCKQWRRFFSDPEFARAHLNHHSSNAPKIIFRNDYSDQYRHRCYSPSFVSVDCEESECNSEVSDRNFPVQNRGRSRIYGSCNGLLCVAFEQHKIESQDLNFYKIVLWNPSTGDYRMLPDSSPVKYKNICDKTIDWTSSLVGFGYDSFSEDYKIVRAFISPVYRFDLFSLKTNSWKVTNSPRPLIRDGLCVNELGTNINETIYWLLSARPKCGKLERWIVGFELRHDKFTELQLPPSHPGSHDIVKLTVIGSCLGLCCCKFNPGRYHLVIWMMNEDKWTKLMVLNRDTEIRPPLCIFENGRKILFIYMTDPSMKYSLPGLQVYDIKVKRIIKTIPFYRVIGRCQEIVMYTETLVSPNAWVA